MAKILDHPIEISLCTVIGSLAPLTFPLFVANVGPVGVMWNWGVVANLLVFATVGIVGGALSIIAWPLSGNKFGQGAVRVLTGSAVSALLTGALLSMIPGTPNPAIWMAVGGFMGFISYPLVLWGGKNGLSLFLNKMSLPTTPAEEPKKLKKLKEPQ